MALNLASKINRQIIQNIGNKLICLKPKISLTRTFSACRLKNGPKQLKSVVSRSRTALGTRLTSDHRLPMQHDVLQRYLEMQRLQPAYLPEYFQNTMDLAALQFPESVLQKPSIVLRFPKLQKEENLEPKLPVVEIPETIPPDLELSRLNETKSSGQLEEAQPLLRVQSRGYCTVGPDSEKCKKLDRKKKHKCVKIKSKCKPPKSILCKHHEVDWPDCKKKEAPYPSYSESCYEELEEKPSECKTCPWKPDEHPTFKPPKKSFHTNTAEKSMRKEECPPPPEPKKPCGWVELEKKEKTKKTNTIKNKSSKTGGKKQSAALLHNIEKAPIDVSLNALKQELPKTFIPIKQPTSYKYIPIGKPTAVTLLSAIGSPFLSVNKFAKHDLTSVAGPVEADIEPEPSCEKKKPCTKPPSPCETREKAKPKPKPKPAKPKPKCDKRISATMQAWLMRNPTVFTNKNSLYNYVSVLADEENESNKCKKFPFEGCKRKVKKKREDDNDRCKPKKKRKIKDCPPPDDSECKRTQGLHYSLSNGKDNVKCPKINLEIKKPDDEEDDPCGLKKKGTTLKCPSDLLKRKRKKPKKKASTLIVPNLAKPTTPSGTFVSAPI